MKKKINEVNGVKVIHRHGPASIFYAVFCLLLGAIPVAILFIPWFTLSISDGSDTIATSLTGINLIKEVLIGEISGQSSSFAYLLTLILSASNLPFLVDSTPLIVLILSYAFPILYMIIALFGLFFIFFALELLFRGRMSHFKAPYVIAWFYFFLVLLFCGIGGLLPFLIGMLFGMLPSSSYTIDLSLWGGDWGMILNFIYLGIAFILLIACGLLYSGAFKNRVFVGDLGDMSREKKKVTDNIDADISKVEISNSASEELIKKVVETPAIGLPPTLGSIGGHAFAENQNLVVAVVPRGIKSLGNGAFANCGRLKLVSLPTSIKAIGANCFFNCANLKRINYAGTKEQWRHIRRGTNWLTKAGTAIVVCVDGPILVNPYH